LPAAKAPFGLSQLAEGPAASPLAAEDFQRGTPSSRPGTVIG